LRNFKRWHALDEEIAWSETTFFECGFDSFFISLGQYQHERSGVAPQCRRKELDHIIREIPPTERANINKDLPVRNAKPFSHGGSRIAVNRLESRKIDATWNYFNRPASLIKTGLATFRKEYFASTFGENDEAVRLLQQPSFDPLCRPI